MVTMESSISGDGQNQEVKFNKYAVGCAVVASVITVIFGYDTGVMSGAMIFIKEELHIKDAKVEVLAGILNIMALFGSLLAGRTSDYIGRRYTIVIASIVFMVGSILMGWGASYGILLAGRCVAGLGVGFALMVAPVYAAEVSSPSSRGIFTALPELGISIGILCGYISNVAFGGLSLRLGWRLMLGIAAIPSVVLALGILNMPESPRWLVMQGKLREAKRILYQVSNSNEEAETRFRDIKVAAGINESCDEDVVKMPEGNKHGDGVWKELLLRPKPAVRWILVAAIGIHFFEHAVGIEAVVLYGPKIFQAAGIADRKKILYANVGIGLTKFTFVLISIFLVDRVGRRKLLLTSVAGVIGSLSVLGTCLTIAGNHKGEHIMWALGLSICTTYLYVAFFNLGLGPITWVYSSEIFPLRLRAQGYSIGVAVNRLMNAIISMTFLSLKNAITIGGAFFMFAGISVIAWFFFFFLFPETKGRSLEDMELLFSKGFSATKHHEGVEIQPITLV